MLTFERKGRPFKFVGNWPCLDFVNTKNWDTGEAVYERFKDYTDLVWWNQAAGNLNEAETQHLLEEVKRRQEETGVLFRRGLLLREITHGIFSAIAAEQPPATIDLSQLNTMLSQSLAQSRLSPTGKGFGWAWDGDETALERIFWPILRSAADLLTSEQLDRVEQCAGESCGWLFLDTSRNRSRRWCEMAHCGNRAKARRHYRRHIVLHATKNNLRNSSKQS